MGHMLNNTMSHPLGVRELKQRSYSQYNYPEKSHPLGVRELKQFLPFYERIRENVAPFRGA